jgi:hypothetical protein
MHACIEHDVCRCASLVDNMIHRLWLGQRPTGMEVHEREQVLGSIQVERVH